MQRYNAFVGTTGGCVKPFGNSSRQVGLSAGRARLSHRVRHADWILRMGDRRIQQDTVDAQFHGDGHIAGRSHTSIHDHRVVRIIFFEILQTDSNRIRIENSLPGSDRAAGWHHAGRPRLLQSTGNHRIVGRVTEAHEIRLPPVAR